MSLFKLEWATENDPVGPFLQTQVPEAPLLRILRAEFDKQISDCRDGLQESRKLRGR